MPAVRNRRVLIVDDTPAIHEDFAKILAGTPADRDPLERDLRELEAVLFDAATGGPALGFELDSAMQGRQALAKVQRSLKTGQPYAVAFVDMRMPPGWDGVETIEHIWRADPRIQVVICTAHSDYSWSEIRRRLDVDDRLLILRKPFDAAEVGQLAVTLAAKWHANRESEQQLYQLTGAVAERAAELRAVNQALQRELDERKRAAAQLATAASVFDHALDGIMIVGADTRIVAVNPGLTSIAGYLERDLVDRPISAVWKRSGVSEPYRRMRDALVRDGCWKGEVEARNSAGETLLLRLSISRVTVEGEPAGARTEVTYVAILSDVTELRRNERRIRHLAFHDPLTDLPNQTQLIERLDESIAAAADHPGAVGLLLVGLDRFKNINDSYGHDVGNVVLQEIAARLRTCAERSYTVARIGGDEFAIVTRGLTEPAEYSAFAQQIIAGLGLPITVAARVMQIGSSVGVARFPDDGGDALELMKHADAAMSAAKAAGRGMLRFYHPSMTAAAEQRLQIEMELRTAVRSGDLELRYQPKVLVETGQLCGVEALVRWRHRGRGLLSPAEFIPIAEESDLICELGDWVLQEVFRQSASWRLRGVGRISVAVNISARQLRSGTLTERITRLASRYDLSPRDVEIELTESSIMDNPEAASALLVQLRALGVAIAIDDFGTGYSSLAYLRRLPIDVLKIDRSFVMNADTDQSDAEIIKTIIALGQVVDLTVVAEGVENHTQLEFLRSYGCDIAQGYLFAPPLTVAQLEQWIRDTATPGTQQLPAAS